jgi:hypothetical protein
MKVFVIFACFADLSRSNEFSKLKLKSTKYYAHPILTKLLSPCLQLNNPHCGNGREKLENS